MATRKVQATLTQYLQTALANNGTLTLPYPAGKVQADFIGGNANADGVLVVNDNDRYLQSASKIALTYNSGDITLQNLTGASIPAGSKLSVGLAIADQTDFNGQVSAAIASPSGGGTVDTQARTAIDAIRVALQKAGITK